MYKGIVGMKNRERIAVLTNHGYTVFDITEGSDVDIGDIISGPLNEHGSRVVANITKKQMLFVYIEAIQETRHTAESLLINI